MTVVSDTSPLNYLILIECVDTLHDLFGSVTIPPAVRRELRHTDAPPSVSAWASVLPDWVAVRAPGLLVPPSQLHPGEQQVLALAQELRADVVLLDDRDARREAERLGLTVVGTLGVLLRAHREGLLELRDALDKLAQTSFRADPDLLRQLVDRASQ